MGMFTPNGDGTFGDDYDELTDGVCIHHNCSNKKHTSKNYRIMDTCKEHLSWLFNNKLKNWKPKNKEVDYLE